MVEKSGVRLPDRSLTLIYAEHRRFQERRQLAPALEILQNLAQQSGIHLFPDTRASRIIRGLTHGLCRLAFAGLVGVAIACVVWLVISDIHQRIRLEPLIIDIFSLGAAIFLLYTFRHALFYTDRMISYPNQVINLYQELGRSGVICQGQITAIDTVDKKRRAIVYKFTESGRIFQGRYVTASSADFSLGHELNILSLSPRNASIIL